MKNEWQREILSDSKYWGKVIAIVNDKIIDYADSYFEIDRKLKDKNINYSTFSVPKRYDSYRVLTFKIN